MLNIGKRNGVALISGLAALTAVLLAGVSANAQNKTGGMIVFANTAGPTTLDPHMSGNTVEMEVVNQVFEGLLALDEQYRPKPMLAAKVDVNADATAFTFTLRKGVKFTNGKEMTSADVRASFERYAKISPNTPLLADVAGYDNPDPYTFVVRLKSPNSVFEDMLATPSYPLHIIPAEEAAKPAKEIEVIGTGPFRVGEWRKDSHLVIHRNPAYVGRDDGTGTDGYGGRKTVHIEGVRYNIVPETNSRLAALKVGDADIATNILPEMSKSLEGSKDLTVHTVMPNCMNVLTLHTQNAPTDNILVRRAIQALIKVDDILVGAGQVAERNPSLLYPGNQYLDPKLAAPYYDMNDIAKAKDLLKQAGYKGEKIVLLTNATYTPMRDSMLIIREAMRAAGMNAEVEVADAVSSFARVHQGTKTWHVTATRFCSQPLLGPQQWRSFVYNFTQVKGDAILDRGFERFVTSVKFEDRKAAWADIERNVLDKAYFIKLTDFATQNAYNRKIVGLKPWYTLRFWNVTIQ